MKKNLLFTIALSALTVTAQLHARSELESITHKHMNNLKAECIAAAQLQKILEPAPSELKRLEKDARWKELNAAFPDLSTKVLHCLWADTEKSRLSSHSSVLDEESNSPRDGEFADRATGRWRKGSTHTSPSTSGSELNHQDSSGKQWKSLANDDNKDRSNWNSSSSELENNEVFESEQDDESYI